MLSYFEFEKTLVLSPTGAQNIDCERKNPWNIVSKLSIEVDLYKDHQANAVFNSTEFFLRI